MRISVSTNTHLCPRCNEDGHNASRCSGKNHIHSNDGRNTIVGESGCIGVFEPISNWFSREEERGRVGGREEKREKER